MIKTASWFAIGRRRNTKNVTFKKKKEKEKKEDSLLKCLVYHKDKDELIVLLLVQQLTECQKKQKQKQKSIKKTLNVKNDEMKRDQTLTEMLLLFYIYLRTSECFYSDQGSTVYF